MYHTCYKKENKGKGILDNNHNPILKDIASDVKVSFNPFQITKIKNK